MPDESQLTITDKRIKEQNITEEMRSSYINYAMSVIVARALPDVKDGLKPVQRRILYAMYKQGFLPSSSYKKSARTVGEVIGKYHPHGDTAVYDAMVRMAQDFSYRYILIDGQGNFGSIDGDSAAAMRYTESRLHKNAIRILTDLEKKTVDFVSTYDGTHNEPVILPSLLPNLLLNGAEGIAVGMATKIPPHNLGELVDAMVEMINKGEATTTDEIDYSYLDTIKTVADIDNLSNERFPHFNSEVEISEILKHIPGPDFPTGAEIYDQEEIKRAYMTGRGRILMRAIAKIEENKSGKFQIIITALPYQVNKANLVSKIAELVKDKKIEGISDIRDESNKLGIRIVIDLKRDSKPKTLLNKLYKYTEMQKAFNANMLALVNGEPKLLNLKRILELFIEHRQEIIIRRSEYDLARAREREHILEGLMIALDNLDEVINTIRSSKDVDIAKENLMKKFKLSEIQSQAILDMQLRRLAALERQKIEEEYKQIKITIADLLALLSSASTILKTIVDELTELKEKSGDIRRTKVHKGKVGEFNEEDLIAKEEVIVTISEQGYIKRMKQDTYTLQKRGGVGKKGMTTKEDDGVAHILSCNTHDEILFFTSKGRMFNLRVYDIPEFGRTARGQAVINLINIEQDETIQSVLTRNPDGRIYDEDITQEGETKTESGKYKFLFMATRHGIVKKTSLEEFANIRANGLIAIKLSDGDELAWVKPTTGKDEIMLITRKARCIRFKEADVRETGRATMGVKGITFKFKEDEVIVMDVIRKLEEFVLSVSELGYGKVTDLSEFPTQNRGGMGVFTARVNKKTGDLASARIIDHPDLELLIITQSGLAVRIPTNELPKRSRQTAGVRLMKMKSDDTVTAIAII
ncbi:MAG: DNA gyrase subunit A [Candidatus Dojkabacteria bacterium]|uniref:DNA gyrase subunit A n=1 Tax=candidate division WS6 bacterium OLB21 TaxID=1617427 RepID=A0A136KJJ2_9BACT|nr:MAG: DNA gyrase subunit A [candidate division WS6 bacterium OLB21]WKZ28348.1 MAG: DNA gyrase subunit A [Candidatus Dojkabacteria bacterium]